MLSLRWPLSSPIHKQRSVCARKWQLLTRQPPGIASLHYLEGCIQEAMRLWPTTPILARESVADDTLEGMALPKGSQIVILNTFTHR